MEKRIKFRRQERSDVETQFWLRVLAFAIDSFIMGLLLVPVMVSGLSFFSMVLGEKRSNDLIDPAFMMGMHMVAFIGYSSIMESSRLQGTIGKWFMRYRVCDLNFNRISLSKALLRNTIKVVSILSFIGVLIIDMTPKRQGLHDWLMETVLVRR